MVAMLSPYSIAMRDYAVAHRMGNAKRAAEAAARLDAICAAEREAFDADVATVRRVALRLLVAVVCLGLGVIVGKFLS